MLFRSYGEQPAAHVLERLEFELDVIRDMGFSAYFLVVWDLVRYAREQGWRVGPGRGSAAGSCVAYCLRIVDIDPIRYDLLFERFLNPGRKQMPDIDMDFDSRYRGDMIRYAAQRYGADHVAQIITFSTIKARAAVRDVARGMPDGRETLDMGKPLATASGIATPFVLPDPYDDPAAVRALVHERGPHPLMWTAGGYAVMSPGAVDPWFRAH